MNSAWQREGCSNRRSCSTKSHVLRMWSNPGRTPPFILPCSILFPRDTSRTHQGMGTHARTQAFYTLSFTGGQSWCSAPFTLLWTSPEIPGIWIMGFLDSGDKVWALYGTVSFAWTSLRRKEGREGKENSALFVFLNCSDTISRRAESDMFLLPL